MEDLLSDHLEETKMLMEESIEHLERELVKVRTGKASPAMLNGIIVSYYGVPTPINQTSNISTADSRTIIIQPFDKSVLPNVEKAIFEANLGVTPQNDGQIIRINIPPLTEERRRQLAKVVRAEGEEAKISIRNARRDAMEHIKKEVKNGYPEDAGKRKEEQVQDWTDQYTKRVETVVENKENEVLTI
jgi:ribosome recycling factor